VALKRLQDNQAESILRDSYEVRLFDETEMISEEHKNILNERILDMQNKVQIQLLQMQEAQKHMYCKLRNYEKLKPQYYGLIDMSLD
jgi:hypothetical protein